MSAADFLLAPTLEAHEPPEAHGLRRDDVRLLVTRGEAVAHHVFADLPGLLAAGDLLVVNDSATLPAAVRLDQLAVHFSTERDDGTWLIVTTVVEDPVYLNAPYVTSPHFKKEPDGSKWDPTPCSSTW